ncbi:MAG: alanine--tRNA ligase [Desulfovibrio sp.]|jgi:alanyl-tRNA synthetase|nr:alanine--tRNA ligase [Desulfovibrio sp.]
MLTAKEIRRRYLAFFQTRGHALVPSAPLIPPNDPTLLFTNAGMVQFKKLFLGEEKREYSRAVSCQKCLRVSGKHNDLENVGRTARHHTFFEMLGNFAFGDYFKREAVTMAWEFVTKDLELAGRDLYVTVFRDDDEAAAIWREIADLPEERIIRMGEKDNFWTMGDTGPCGPCSEIYIDQGADMACGPDCGIGRCDCDRFLEIWNLVFTQFDQLKNGERVPLAAPNIDTGMGLERVAAVCQGKRSNFDCDLFQEIIQHAAELAHVTYSFSAPDTDDVDTALRVIADHSRAAAFLIADGVLPSNENRGYVLRRLIRRALRFATLMGVNEPFLYKTARKTTDIMGHDYPELARSADFISRAVFEEEQRFSLTLEKGLRLLDEELRRLESLGKTEISGDFCFRLYDTYGFPLDIVTDVAGKRGFSANAADFETNMLEQRERARKNRKADMQNRQGKDATLPEHLEKDGLQSVFVGYESLTAQSRIVALLDADGQPAQCLDKGQSGFVVTGKTPFYGESGGQTGDRGFMASTTGQARVNATLRPSQDLIVHAVAVSNGSLLPDQEVTLGVDSDARESTARNHTCTHLLHAALRRTLGTHVKQAGSLVDDRRLRFDFSHITALTQEELAAVERDVNRAILADLPVSTREMPHEEALSLGAMALFGEKYGKTVRVVSVGEVDAPQIPESVELCGGTHLRRTGQAGMFLIVSETGVAAGTRRIEAVTGWNAYSLAIEQRTEISALSSLLKARPGQLAERVQTMHADIKKLRKSSEKAPAAPNGADTLEGMEEVNGVRILAKQLETLPVKALRERMDDTRSRLTTAAVACLATVEEEKVTLLLYVSKDLHSRFTAPALIRDVAAACGGAGGGRPDLAQAGGTKPEGLPDAFALLKTLVAKSAT